MFPHGPQHGYAGGIVAHLVAARKLHDRDAGPLQPLQQLQRVRVRLLAGGVEGQVDLPDAHPGIQQVRDAADVVQMQVRDEQRINVASLCKKIIQRGLPVAARVDEDGLVPIQQQGGIRLSYGKLDVA